MLLGLRQNFLIVLFLLLANIWPLPIPAATVVNETPEETTARLQQRYTQLSSLSFLFFQTTEGQMTGRPKSGKGNALFVKTGDKTLMRWNYNAPERQVIISDGTTVSMYFEKLTQMIIAPVDVARVDFLFAFFSGSRSITDDFTILPPNPDMVIESDIASNKLTVVQLKPLQKESQIRSIHLFVANDSLIRRIELIDDFDTRTTINLSTIEVDPIDVTNEAAVHQLFDFIPPEGTEIIRQ